MHSHLYGHKSTNKKLHRQTMSFMQHIVCKGSGDEFQRSLKVEDYVFGEFGVLSFSGLPFVLCSMVCLPTTLGITQT